MQRILLLLGAAIFAGAVGIGCARQAKTPEHVAAINPEPPRDLGRGPMPLGGESESPTGAGAGGSGAAGVQAGRVGGPDPLPTTPAYPYGVRESRMSPIATDGSANADRGKPLAPEQPLVPANTTGVTQQFTDAPGQMPVNVDLR